MRRSRIMKFVAAVSSSMRSSPRPGFQGLGDRGGLAGRAGEALGEEKRAVSCPPGSAPIKGEMSTPATERPSSAWILAAPGVGSPRTPARRRDGGCTRPAPPHRARWTCHDSPPPTQKGDPLWDSHSGKRWRVQPRKGDLQARRRGEGRRAALVKGAVIDAAPAREQCAVADERHQSAVGQLGAQVVGVFIHLHRAPDIAGSVRRAHQGWRRRARAPSPGAAFPPAGPARAGPLREAQR